jgi:hypothetical protein
VAQPKELERQIRAVRRSLTALERALARLGRTLGKLSPPPPGSARSRPRRRLRLSPERRAALALHGRYLGHVRLLKPAQKARVKALLQAKGYRAAIKLAQSFSRK